MDVNEGEERKDEEHWKASEIRPLYIYNLTTDLRGKYERWRHHSIFADIIRDGPNLS